MAAQVEYEVREEYQDYSLEQLLESPVTCFQGVGDTQSELLERYFNVKTVKDLADMGAFLEALAVQETVLQGGDFVTKSVDELAGKQELAFHIRQIDQNKRLMDLPSAPVHVLEGLTPGQDLALYDSFRITNLTQLAHNRIMLEARVIDYLSRMEEGGAEHTAGQDAIASILGARAAAAASAKGRAESVGAQSDIQSMASEVTDHVRDRVEAMRDRARDRAETRGAGDMTGTSGARLDSIRDSHRAGGGRGADLERLRAGKAEETLATRSGPPARNRAESVLAARGTAGLAGDTVRSISERRSSEGLGRPSPGGRADSVRSARESMGRGAPSTSTSASGGAMVRTRTKEKEEAKKPAEADKAAATELTTEEEAQAKAKAAAARRRRPPRPNPVPLIAAAVVVVLLLAGLIYFLVTSGDEESAERMAETGQAASEQGTAAGTTPGAAQQGQATVAPPPPPPPRIKATHVVRRGESLWRISREQYADPLNWPSIFMENQDQISNPDLIHPAQEFRIPSKPEYRFPDYPKGYSRTR